MISAKPMMAFSGVRSSWLMFARNWLFARLAASAASFACSSRDSNRSEEHTSELQSLMRISYAVFCLKTETTTTNTSVIQEASFDLIHPPLNIISTKEYFEGTLRTHVN